MDAIERAANLSVSRACAFSGLAALCMMVGFSQDPHLSARVGGSVALLTTLVLVWKARIAHSIPYKRTETWLILEDSDRPSAEIAQDTISSILRTTFLFYAKYSAVVAVVLLAASVIFGLIFR